jgi:hypothetical protein
MKSSTHQGRRLLAAALILSASLCQATPELTEDEFEKLTSSGQNGMVKFYQPWCGQ